MEIIKPGHNTFDFKRLHLANPEPLQNGSYFTKITVDDKQPLFLQLPKCNTKQGILDVKGAKFCDLMYERSIQELLMTWLEQLEYACQDKLNEKKELWFQTELSRDDIESMMSPIMRLYQSGKYVLIRTSLLTQKTQGLDKSIAYNEQEVNIDIDKILATDYIVPLLVVNGIRFSARSFEIDIKLSQMMIFDRPMETTCLIKLAGGPNVNSNVVGASTAVASTPIANVVGASTPIANASTPIANVVGASTAVASTAANVVAASTAANANVVGANANVVGANANVVGANVVGANAIQSPCIIETTPKNTNALEEVFLDFNDITDTVNIKKPNEVYYEIYRTARTKAKQLRKIAMEAYLEAKEIKTKFMLNDIADSEESEEESEESDYDDSTNI